jgi:hypothetical protein
MGLVVRFVTGRGGVNSRREVKTMHDSHGVLFLHYSCMLLTVPFTAPETGFIE